RAVVDERHQWTRDLSTDAAAEDAGVLADQVGLEAMAARLVEQHAAGALLEDDGQLAAGGGAGLEHVEASARGRAGHVFNVDLVVQLEADRAPGALVAGLHARVADGHALDHEPGADLIV